MCTWTWTRCCRSHAGTNTPRWSKDRFARVAGVANAHVEGALGRLVVELDDDADADVVLETVRDVVNSAASDLFAAGREPQIRIAPFADPGNPLAILVPLTAAAFDAVAIGAAVTGWVVKLPAAPEDDPGGRGPAQQPAAGGRRTRVPAGPGRHRPRAQRPRRPRPTG